MAAAAALSRSRGVAGVRATKGLLSIFTLLCLVCLSNSLTNKDKLKKLVELIEKDQQQLDTQMAELATSSELMNYYVSLMDPLMELVKPTSEDSPNGFPPLKGLMDCLKNFAEEAKTFVDGKNEELGEKIEKNEQSLRTFRNMINTIEEQEAEL